MGTEQPIKTGVAIQHQTGDRLDSYPEQPNQNAMIVKTIQGLMTCVENELVKLHKTTEQNVYNLVTKALDETDLFEKTTLFDLQEAFE